MAALNACTIDQNMDIVIHSLEGAWEETADLVKIFQVAVNNSSRTSGSDNRIGSIFILDAIWTRRTLYKTYVCACLRKGNGTSSTYAACCTSNEDIGTMKVKELEGR
jgi:hypothetical protein